MDKSRIHEALSNKYRRRLLCRLLEKDNSEAVRIPDSICKEEDDPELVHMLLYHNHLPKLEDAGLIQYSDDQELVKKGEFFLNCQSYLRQLMCP